MELKKHPAELFEKYKGHAKENAVRCNLCAHYCVIEEGEEGICLVRNNEDGRLFTRTWGFVQGSAIDPVEKKPFYHFKPGSKAMSFGTPGCNFECANCQNRSLSGFFYDYKARGDFRLVDLSISKMNGVRPEQLIQSAIRHNVDGIAYTYSEPTIFFEYAHDIIKKARKTEGARHLYHCFISNGYFSKELMDLIEEEDLIDAVNIDLKFMDEKKYRDVCGAHVKPVLNSIERISNIENIHLEVINLVIPGENDKDDDLKELSEFLASVSTDIPLHFSRFHPQYQMSNKPATPIATLKKAQKTAKEAGMKYIYVGNADIPKSQNTYCPNCGELLIERMFYGLGRNVFQRQDSPECPNCSEKINIIL